MIEIKALKKMRDLVKHDEYHLCVQGRETIQHRCIRNIKLE